MATSGQVPLFTTDPNIQAQAQLLQQRQALAQALLSEGMKPLDTSNRQIGGVAYHVSPLEGLAKMLQSYTGEKNIQNNIGQQAQLASQAYGNLLQRYQTGTPSYSDQQVSDAGTAGMNGDGMGPPDPQKVAQALMGQSPANSGVNPNNPAGIPAPILAQHNAGMMDDETFKALTSGYQATDATKAALQGGMDPQQTNRLAFGKSITDPKILAMKQAGMSDEQINQAVAGEAQKNATQAVRPEQSLYQFSGTGAPQLRAVAPDSGNNMQFSVNNGQVSAMPVQGAVPNKSNMVGGTSAASTAGSTAESLHEVTLPDGSKVKVKGKDITAAPDADRTAIYQGEMKAANQRLADAKTPEEKARAQADINGLTREMKRAGIPQGQSTANKVLQEDSGKTLSALPQQITQSKQTVVGLENALKTLEGLKSGPGVSKTVNALAMVNNMGIPLMAGDTNGYQTLKKFLENAAASAGSATGATRTDAQFEQFRAGQPNAETMNPKALEGAIRYVLSQQDAALHNGSYVMQKAGNDPNKLQSARQEWSSQYNPRYFEVQRMAPQDQRSAVQNMSPADAAAFLQWRKSLKAQ